MNSSAAWLYKTAHCSLLRSPTTNGINVPTKQHWFLPVIIRIPLWREQPTITAYCLWHFVLKSREILFLLLGETSAENLDALSHFSSVTFGSFCITANVYIHNISLENTKTMWVRGKWLEDYVYPIAIIYDKTAFHLWNINNSFFLCPFRSHTLSIWHMCQPSWLLPKGVVNSVLNLVELTYAQFILPH